MAREGKKNLLQNSLILMAAALISKVLGAVFKIPLTNILGEDGLGYFQTAYNIYMPIYVICMAGFPGAVSRMVAAQIALGNYKTVRKIHDVALKFFLCTGTAGFCILFFGGPYLAELVGNEPAYISIMVLAPTVFLCCVMSSYRGYYNGLSNMLPTAISQVIEALGKLVIGYSASIFIMNMGMNEYYSSGTVFGTAYANETAAKMAVCPYAAAGAIAGVTVGTIFACGFVIIRHKILGDGITKEQLISPNQQSMTTKAILKRLLSVGIPFAIASAVMQISSLVDTFSVNNIIKLSLQSNEDIIRQVNGFGSDILTEDIPNKLFGLYSTALTFYNLIPMTTMPFATGSMPTLTSAYTLKNKEDISKTIKSVLRMALLFAVPEGVLLSVLSKQIMMTLYPTQQYVISIGSEILSVLAIAGAFAGMCQPVNSMMQSIGKFWTPVKIMAMGALIKLTVNVLLIFIPELNIFGATFGTLACFVFILAAGLYCLQKYTDTKIGVFKTFLPPVISSLASGAGAYVISRYVTASCAPIVNLLVSGVCALVIYVIFIFLTGAVTKHEIVMLPKGKLLAEKLEKLHIIK